MLDTYIARLEEAGEKTAADVLRKLLFLGVPKEIVEEIALGFLGSSEEKTSAMTRALVYLEGAKDISAHNAELYVLFEEALRERLFGLAKLSRTLLSMSPAMVSAVIETVPPYLEEFVKDYLAACMSVCHIEPRLVPELFLGEMLALEALSTAVLGEKDSVRRWRLIGEIQKLCGERPCDLKSALQREKERRRKLELEVLRILRGGEGK